MGKLIKVDFSKRGKDLFYLKKQRKEEKKWQRREERITALFGLDGATLPKKQED